MSIGIVERLRKYEEVETWYSGGHRPLALVNPDGPEAAAIITNSGFEPRTFDDEVFARWRVINKGPWRFAYDDMQERPYVERVMKMLRDVPARRKRVYVLIGNEPFAACMERIREVIAWGGEPHVQPYMKLNALERTPYPRFDWNKQLLRDVARWANGHVWRRTDFNGYRRSHKSKSVERYDEQQGLFV